MPTIKKYKVTSAAGFHFGGKRLDRGTVFEADAKSAHIITALHFRQIAAAEEKSAEKPEAKPDPKEPPAK